MRKKIYRVPRSTYEDVLDENICFPDMEKIKKVFPEMSSEQRSDYFNQVCSILRIFNVLRSSYQKTKGNNDG